MSNEDDKDDTDGTDGTKDDMGNVVEFISREEYDREYRLTEQEQPDYIDPDRAEAKVVDYDPNDSFSSQFERLANENNGATLQSSKRLSLPKELNRRQVSNAFMDAFHLIGGVPRLAYWADSHPTEFYKLYARLLPSQAQKDVHETNERRIIHALPPTALDE